MKIAIAGYGAEGESNYRYFAQDPTHELTVVDQHQPERAVPDDVLTIIGEDAFSNLDGFDMVIRTAGLPPSKIKTDGLVWSATNEFFRQCPAPVVGVTGSKGKGTTASLIASILRAAGKKVWLVGNIGVPALDVLAEINASDVVVYELSSFQLWDIQRSPHIAVILPIEQEHLDVHADMEDYVGAKGRIAMFQTNQDILIFYYNNQYSRAIAGRSSAARTAYPDTASAHVKDGSFYYGEHVLCSVGALQLIGQHNRENTCAAIDAVWSFTQSPAVIEAGISRFTGLPHRLKFVREVANVQYYDDSIATTPVSAIAALRAFTLPKVIILGGSSKGANFDMLGIELRRHDAQAILIGDEANAIAASCQKAGFEAYEILTDVTMSAVVERAAALARPGSVVLLSPSSASFGMFRNYVDRGDQYIAAVKAL